MWNFRNPRGTIALTLASALLLAGCTSAADDSKQSAGAGSGSGSGDGVVTWLTARQATDPTVQAVEYLAAKYKETHPDFTLEVESISDRPSYDQKIKILASSNQLPEMFDNDPTPYFQELVNQGNIADINALYEELGVVDDFYPISLDYPKFADGSLNLITLQAVSEYFWYDKALFEQAGVTPPKTFAEFMDVCEKLKAAGITPISLDGKDKWPYFRFLAMMPLRESGNDFLNQLGTGETTMSSPTGIKAITFLEDLAPYFQPGVTSTDYTTSLGLFTSGQAAMTYQGTWELGSFLDETGDLKDSVGYFPMPTDSSSDQTAATDYFANSGLGTAILKDALTPELKDFLKYFFENYADTALYEFNVIPSIKPTIRPELPAIYKDILNDISQVNTYAKVWDVQLDPNTVSILGRESENLLVGTTTPEKFAEQVDQALEQYNSGK